MALHVRGVVLPDDETRDLWLTEERVSLEPVPDAVTISTTGFILTGLVDAHCHIGIAPGGARSPRSTTPVPSPRRTGTPVCSPSGTPARPTRTPNSTTTPACHALPAPAGTSRRP